MTTRYIDLAVAAMLCAMLPDTTLAQYNQEISVEGKYTPEYIQRPRINIFPDPMHLSAGESQLPWQMGGEYANFLPEAIPQPATGWRDTRKFDHARGYLDLNLGSWLDADLSAGSRIIDSDDSVLGVRLQYNSTSLWEPAGESRRERYDADLGVYGAKRFEDKGRLYASLDYSLGYFNYYGWCESGAPTQTLNNLRAEIGWQSNASGPDSGSEKFNWYATIGVDYFGYRSLYLPISEAEPIFEMPGLRETRTMLDAGLNFQVSSKSSLGLDLSGNLMIYKQGNVPADFRPDNYGLVTMRPYYKLGSHTLSLRVGAALDLSFNNPTFKSFHIAPDISLDYNAGECAIFARLTGGSELHTLASDRQLDYYSAPVLGSQSPVYSPLDSRLGVNFGPWKGFRASAEIGYKVSLGQPFGGLYGLGIIPEGNMRIAGMTAQAMLGYDAGKIFGISAKTTYQPQDKGRGYFNGYDRPVWTAEAEVRTNPWSTLSFALAYQMRARRGVWYAAGEIGNELEKTELPNQSLLSLTAHYGITDRIGVSLQADNLLCRRRQSMPGISEPGLRVMAGLNIRF